MGRVFGVRDALGAWAFGVAFIGAGAILALVGTRPLILVAGVGALAVWAASAVALKGPWEEPAAPERDVSDYSAGAAAPGAASRLM